MRLIYITPDPLVGEIAQRTGVDWVFVDMEYRGKSARQAHRDTVVSAHTLSDVRAMRAVIQNSQLMVRVNPIGEWSEEEINDVAQTGADIIMLPFFKTAVEVQSFVSMVNGRTQTCLLLETLEAIEVIDEILMVPGVDFVHIGLNDIHIIRGTTFMFEFLADGGVDRIALKLRGAGIEFGFGGMARIGMLSPPAEHILAEHFRLGSTGVILSRSFCKPSQAMANEAFEKMFTSQVTLVRAQEELLVQQSPEFFERNRQQVIKEVQDVVAQIKASQI
jgi:hypothetical protein